jgi:hypothetical protein
MVPLPDFTTHDPKTKEKTVKRGLLEYLEILLESLLEWREILYGGYLKFIFPPFYKDLDDNEFSRFLQIEKNNGTFFSIPTMEAVINSRWKQTKRYFMIHLIYYVVFLVSFSLLSWFYLSDNYQSKTYRLIMVAIFYSSGIYLLIVEIMQVAKYGRKYFTLFNLFDLCSIILGIIIFSLIFANSIKKINGFNYEWAIFATSVIALLLWIEMVCLMYSDFMHKFLIELLIYINLLLCFIFSSFYGYDYFQE